MVEDDLDWPNGGCEDDCLMVLHHFGQQLLEAFPAMESFSDSSSRSGCIGGTLRSDLVGLGVVKDGSLVKGFSPFFFPSSSKRRASRPPFHIFAFIGHKLISSPSISSTFDGHQIFTILSLYSSFDFGTTVDYFLGDN